MVVRLVDDGEKLNVDDDDVFFRSDVHFGIVNNVLVLTVGSKFYRFSALYVMHFQLYS